MHDLICSDSHSNLCGGNHSSCSSNAADSCNSSSPDNNGKECNSIYCAVNILSNGLLALDFTLAFIDKITIEVDPVVEYLISHYGEEEKRAYFVRGPPENSQA
ncbi:hypothetical protein OA542_01055 [Opitutae bacterium]|nr:hypothetical protein [Opitutae bacterium]